MNIRRAAIEDFEQIYALLPQLWPNDKLNKRKLRIAFSRSINSKNQQYLCAIDKKTVIAFCSLSIRNSLWQQGTLAHIDEIIVDQAYRGQGIGTALIRKTSSITVKAGCTRLELDSAFHRKRAHGPAMRTEHRKNISMNMMSILTSLTANIRLFWAIQKSCFGLVRSFTFQKARLMPGCPSPAHELFIALAVSEYKD